MAEGSLRLVVQTPLGVVWDEPARSLRVPTDSGQVGLRPRAEPCALVVEPGLVLCMGPQGLRFVATAGGLLRCDGAQAVLLTPLAVAGEDAESVRAGLETALAAPRAAFELRAVLQRLETGILLQLRGVTPEETGGGVGTRRGGLG